MDSMLTNQTPVLEFFRLAYSEQTSSVASFMTAKWMRKNGINVVSLNLRNDANTNAYFCRLL